MTRTLPRLPESKRAEMVAAVRSFCGVRWRHLGRTERGVDCIGLVIAGLRKCGVEVADVAAYPRRPDGSLRPGLIERLGEPVQAWREGDVVLMRWNAAGFLHTHVGVLGLHNGDWTLIHAYLGTKSVIEHRIDATWRARITDCFSLTGGAP